MNNPPAFPVSLGSDGNDSFEQGMTLRDYFAAKALQGLLPNHAHGQWPDAEPLAAWAWRIADAMLKAREQTQ